MGSHNIRTITSIKVGNYLVRDDGLIWSLQKNKFLSPFKTNKGYYCVTFNGCKKTVHRIIAETFLLNSENCQTVNHINGNRVDNQSSNLEWCSYSQNNQHAWDMNRDSRTNALKKRSIGSNNRQSKLTEKDIVEIRRFFVPNKIGIKKELAKKYNVSVGTIKQVVARASWVHVE